VRLLYLKLERFFVVDAQVAPTLMMRVVPGAVLVIVSMLEVLFISIISDWIEIDSTYLLIPVMIHWLVFIAHGVPLESEKLFDITGQIAFTVLNVYAYKIGNQSIKSLIACILCIIWSCRLGIFLFVRILKRKSAFRFVECKSKFGYSFFAWTNQGVWCYFQGLGLVDLHNFPANSAIFLWYDIFFLLLALIGLGIESIADFKK